MTNFLTWIWVENTFPPSQQVFATVAKHFSARVSRIFLVRSICNTNAQLLVFLRRFLWRVNKSIHEITRTEKQLTRKLLDLIRVISWIMSLVFGCGPAARCPPCLRGERFPRPYSTTETQRTRSAFAFFLSLVGFSAFCLERNSANPHACARRRLMLARINDCTVRQ